MNEFKAKGFLFRNSDKGKEILSELSKIMPNVQDE